MAQRPGITVLVPTHNRAEVLRETLGAFAEVDAAALDCQFVVIDNNCTDDTQGVLETYHHRLPLVTLKEERPGKNCALNKALREVPLKEIVLFTDDDVTPAKNWLREVAASAVKWPEVPVFGGRIELVWPAAQEPAWAAAEWIKNFAFCGHHYSDQETFYRPPDCPFGGNYWVRSSVFRNNSFFDETIGPRPTNRIMGSETSFLRRLQGRGAKMLYCPGGMVHHRIQERECEIAALRRRAYTFGRGQVRLHGWHRANLLGKSKTLWGATLAADLCYTAVRYGLGATLWNAKQNCEMTVSAMMRFGQLRETFEQYRKAVDQRPL